MCNYKISVIVPVYNIEKYISRCLESIINQTYKNLEIIVIDDGSSDNTGKIIDDFAKRDKRVIVIHQDNKGVSSARNKGLDIATGQYIGFVDGDDTLDKDMYDFLLKNIKKYDADISHCGYRLIEDKKETLFYGSGKIIIQDRKKGILDLMDGSLIEPTLCNKLFKRQLLEYIRLDENIKINEDLYFNILAFNNSNKSVFQDYTKYNYIKREGSASTSSCNNIIAKNDCRKVYREIIKFFAHDSEILPYAEKMDLLRNINIYNLLCLENNKEALELKHKVKNYIKLNKKIVEKNRLISKKSKCMIFGIIYISYIYELIYKIYFNKKYK